MIGYEIDINTKFVTLLGTPLAQSYAARMQNAAYRASKINMVYFYTEADSTYLGEIIDGLRRMSSFAGCAVTKPNKVAVMEYLDAMDPLCEMIGSCNTVVKFADKMYGYNTDASGFLKALEKIPFKARGEKTFCIGAGGVGRAICMALSYAGVERVYVTDRVESVARELVRDINSGFYDRAEYVPFQSFSSISDCALVVNASGIGMAPSLDETPLPEEYLKPGTLYFDACYNPSRTRFLREAERAGAAISNGLDMSLYQGIEQIRLWSGEGPDEDVMRDALYKIISENQGIA